MKNTLKKISLLFMALVLTVLAFSVSASAAGITTGIPEDFINAQKYKIVISAEDFNVNVRGRLQLEAKVTGVEVQPKITWSSSNESVATVSDSGKVRGISVGRSFITAKATVAGKPLEAVFAVNVVTSDNVIKNFLMKNQVLSYQYSYQDDYYYTNDKDCWQDNFGFARVYDIVSPYIALEYDYTRVFFEYDNQDFMVQLWKGQYGYIFYGGEIGIYHKEADGKETGYFTFFKTADQKYWPKMEMTLYHQQLNGEWKREFTRDYDYYWWCTGFKPGHLRQVEPADELRIVARITFTDKEMATLFANGLKDCNFSQASSKDAVGLDSYYQQGRDVYLQWQNISEAESTMGIKFAAGSLFAINLIGLILGTMFSMGLGSLVFLFIL
ncbi:MAG: DUF4474 domain-containing protein [Clostridia bacterium]|nr:DUF4474 domain-containing protein [Clostridia bacterium]